MSFDPLTTLGVAGATTLAVFGLVRRRRAGTRPRRPMGGEQTEAVPERPAASARNESAWARSLALDAISEAVLIVQEDGRILDCNSAALSLFVRHRHSVEGEFASSLRTLGADGAQVYRSARERGVWSGESRARLPDGSTALCITRIVPMRDRDGRLAVFCESYRDVVGEQLVGRDLRDRLFGVQSSGDSSRAVPAPHASLTRLGAAFRDLEILVQRYEQVIDALSEQDLAEPLAGLVHDLREANSSDSTRALLAEIPSLLAGLRARLTRRAAARKG